MQLGEWSNWLLVFVYRICSLDSLHWNNATGGSIHTNSSFEAMLCEVIVNTLNLTNTFLCGSLLPCYNAQYNWMGWGIPYAWVIIIRQVDTGEHGVWIILCCVLKENISTGIRKNHSHRKSKWTGLFTRLMCPDLLAYVGNFFWNLSRKSQLLIKSDYGDGEGPRQGVAEVTSSVQAGGDWGETHCS